MDFNQRKKILIVAATEGEVQGVSNYISSYQHSIEDSIEYDVLVTGVGMMATTYTLTKYLCTHEVDYLIQMGIAGSFSRTINIGDVIQIESEAMGDLGAEDKEEFMDIFQMNLLDENEYPFDNKLLFEQEVLPKELSTNLKKVHGITINTTSGHNPTIERRRKRFAAQVESMEGAAFHYVCSQFHKPFIQVRAISNYVTERDTSQWQIKKAIDNVNNWIINNIIK